jgi:trans-aconitate 2-methyltransferase
MAFKDWNPDLYLKFHSERTQPAIDLVSRINIDNPEKIIDIGCGPGNSTQILFQRWPESKILGVDNSPAMIEKAIKDYPHQDWRILDVGKEEIHGKYDLIFSNATIQWIPDHSGLLLGLHAHLTDNGIIAVQMPLFWDMPLGKAIDKIASDNRWVKILKGVKELFTIHNCAYYYNVLSQQFNSIVLWETNYVHVMGSHLSILEMIRSTGLKPYLEFLENSSDKNDFETMVLKQMEKDYPLQDDSMVLFPFKRLFFIAKK